VSEAGKTRALTKANEALMAQINLTEAEKIRFKSKDGTPVEGYLYRPVGYQAGLRYPTLLRIPRGPGGAVRRELQLRVAALRRQTVTWWST